MVKAPWSGIATVVAFAALVTLVAGCRPIGNSGQQTAADNLRTVYRLGPEYICTPAAPGCEVAVAAATRQLQSQVPSAVITGTAMADPKCGDVNTLCTFAGLEQPEVVVFDLADGSRRYVGLMCGGPTTTQDGTVVSPRICTPADLPLPSP